MKVFAAVVLALAASFPANAALDPKAQERALEALCPIGLKAGGIWGDDNINGAIATIRFGQDWPDSAQATAYKLCNTAGYLD